MISNSRSWIIIRIQRPKFNSRNPILKVLLPVFEFSTEKDLIRSVDWFIKAELKS